MKKRVTLFLLFSSMGLNSQAHYIACIYDDLCPAMISNFRAVDDQAKLSGNSRNQALILQAYDKCTAPGGRSLEGIFSAGKRIILRLESHNKFLQEHWKLS